MSELYATSSYATDEQTTTGALFSTSRLLVRAARRRDADAVYAFAQANPEYELMATGTLPPRDEYVREFFEDKPPPEMTYSELFKLVVLEKSAAGVAGEVVGLLDVCANLRAKDVWHTGYFHVATRLQGSGVAQALYTALEDWMASQGAQMLRLGVLDANARGKAFWQRNGYQFSHTRKDMPYGPRKHDVHVLLKPIGTMTIAQYRALVPQDSPQSVAA
jgi:GNAT superfamily N-acetyltransferase